VQGTDGATQVQVFPNPANGHTFVILPLDVVDAVQINVHDNMGRLVKQQRAMAQGRIIELDLAGLASGTYVCVVSVEDGLHQNIPIVVTE